MLMLLGGVLWRGLWCCFSPKPSISPNLCIFPQHMLALLVSKSPQDPTYKFSCPSKQNSARFGFYKENATKIPIKKFPHQKIMKFFLEYLWMMPKLCTKNWPNRSWYEKVMGGVTAQTYQCSLLNL